MGSVSTPLEIRTAHRLRWGWCRFRPDSLQFFRKPQWALFFICCGVFIQGYGINGLLHIVLPTLERRFNLKSSQTGMICAVYDVPAVTLLIPITYFGGLPSSSKPLWYGNGLLFLGAGMLTFVIPEVIESAREITEIMPICNETNYLDRKEVCRDQEEKPSPVYWIFISASLLCGTGGCMLYTLGITYLDDCVTRSKSSIYFGFFYISVILGTSCGFITGGLFLRVRSNFIFPKRDTNPRGPSIDPIHPEDASFNGAWWLGFLCSGIFCIIIAIFNLGFPFELPGASEIRASKGNEAHAQSAVNLHSPNPKNIKSIFKSVFNLLKNPTLVFLSLAACCDFLIVSGASVFLPKILENQFNMSNTTASIIIGAVSLSGGIVGIIVGGLTIKHFQLNCKQMIKLCIYLCGTACICIPAVLLHCPNRRFAGISVTYISSQNNITNFCNIKCNCHEENYYPVCGIDGVSYYSPCYAGCHIIGEKTKGVQEFHDCSCIKANRTSNSWKPDATSKVCTTLCASVFIFIPAMVICLLALFSAVVPGITTTLRCVRVGQRSLAMGLQWMFIRTCTIGGLSFIGSRIDSACFHWQRKCAEQGPCVLYDNRVFSVRLFVLAISAKVIGLISLTAALFTYKPASPQ